MPPIGQADVNSLSDEQLSDMLKEYGVDVGPINVATRGTYERYLIKLRTGQTSPPSHFEPVDDDEEDEDTEVILKHHSPKKENQPSSISHTQPRQRHEPQENHIPTPKGDSLSRPPLFAARKTTSTPYTSTPRPTGSSSSQHQPQNSGSIPAWVKVTVVVVLLVLVYLIYTNMEPTAVSNIPSIQNKVEV
ncbi:emerin homolog 1 [Plakobranchus ocellatus]|uniref:Emerin homolog 1 n=1 Tax=Plakobranchus ocellatus TaxID=259542 RepID=A0AAV3XXW1_9GAST|nr:emerin homolog 1 [Plakobranchus ocellatus]